jgi:LacI family transcriptional regulator, galactose operon repressor
MAKRPPSIKQVADEAGVSIATVSNVFSGKKPVTHELAEHVRAVADSVGYRVNRAASNLRTGRNKIITVLVPDLSDPFFTSLVTELEKQVQVDGYDIIIANAGDDLDVQRRRVAALLSWQPAGMVIVPCTDQLPEQLDAARAELPIVIVDRGAEAADFDTVRIDNADAAEIAAKHLVELGHRDVLIAASNLSLEAIRERCRGARERIEASGGVAETVEVGADPQQGAELLARWLDRNRLPSAILGVTDMTTLAVLSCLAERKYEIGQDVSVVGFDDYPWMSARRTPITAVQQPVKEIVDRIWATLKSRLEGFDGAPEAKVLQCSLKVRASSRRVSRPGKEIGSGEKRQSEQLVE